MSNSIFGKSVLDASEIKVPLDQVRIIFADLDGTLYPGFHEKEPKRELRGLMKNLQYVSELERDWGIPVIPATGNNLVFAQAKFCDPSGRVLRDLRTSPGIYCNGALVKGAGGKELDVKSLGKCLRKQAKGDPTNKQSNFIQGFLERFENLITEGNSSLDSSKGFLPSNCCGGDEGEDQPVCLTSDCSLVGLGKDTVLVLDHRGLGPRGRQTASEWIERMAVKEEDLYWVSPVEMVNQAIEILSFLWLFPKSTMTNSLLLGQSWLHENGLVQFSGASERKSNGQPSKNFKVVCKHVHVPGIGPEIDFSPAGVNKGSAIIKMLRKPMDLGLKDLQMKDLLVRENMAIAVFGDAGNDIELFGMKRTIGGDQLEPLEHATSGGVYRPGIRVSMPWANDKLLLADANMHAEVHVVLSGIVKALKKKKKRDGSKI